uniref:Uncharacterized protein n=1 Tax=Candidatus Kentrum sp. FW TaxID=2126338 RepID=A0A450TDR0_9GAMM|nr:MAG: hypothetical protein BECKFW1821B_GA0114236_11001 [Candidatus Kentron sp. FW]
MYEILLLQLRTDFFKRPHDSFSIKFSEALPRTFDAGLFSSLPIRFGQSGIAELYSAKIRENPKDAEYNSAIPGKTERFDQTNRYH